MDVYQQDKSHDGAVYHRPGGGQQRTCGHNRIWNKRNGFQCYCADSHPVDARLLRKIFPDTFYHTNPNYAILKSSTVIERGLLRQQKNWQSPAACGRMGAKKKKMDF